MNELLENAAAAASATLNGVATRLSQFQSKNFLSRERCTIASSENILSCVAF
jgi:hypothetical protein